MHLTNFHLNVHKLAGPLRVHQHPCKRFCRRLQREMMCWNLSTVTLCPHALFSCPYYICSFCFNFFRPVLASKFSDNLASLFHLYVLSVPALVLHLASTAPKVGSVLFTKQGPISPTLRSKSRWVTHHYLQQIQWKLRWVTH